MGDNGSSGKGGGRARQGRARRYTSVMRNVHLLVAAAVAGTLLSCGQKGALVLPDAQHPHKKLPVSKPAAVPAPPGGAPATSSTPPTGGAPPSAASGPTPQP